MARYTYNFRYDAQGVIDYDHYRAKAQAARDEMRVRVFNYIMDRLFRGRTKIETFPGRARTKSA